MLFEDMSIGVRNGSRGVNERFWVGGVVFEVEKGLAAILLASVRTQKSHEEAALHAGVKR